MEREIVTCGGKYRTVNSDGVLKVYRYEKTTEPWRKADLVGDGYILSLVQRIEELEDEISELKNCI